MQHFPAYRYGQIMLLFILTIIIFLLSTSVKAQSNLLSILETGDGNLSTSTAGNQIKNEKNFSLNDLSKRFRYFAGGGMPFSIGNRIWLDDGSDGAGGFNASQRNNGLQDAGERGVNGVRVELYRDDNNNSIPDANEFIRFDTTAAGTAGAGRPGTDQNGYYLFDNLGAGSYFIVIPASEFQPNMPLGGWHSSTFNGTETSGVVGATGNPPTDLDDNGIEPTNRRPDLSGVSSGVIVLIDVAAGNPGLEVTGETDLSLEPDPGAPANDAAYNGTGGIGPTGWDGPASIGRWNLSTMDDDNSNVAVDFGFTPPMSLGNRIWLDDSNDTTQWQAGGSRNNSLIDATDDGNFAAVGLQNPGITSVNVDLYMDNNNNSTIDGGDTLINSTTTTANGYYLFDGLANGNYLIRIPAAEFAVGRPLNGLVSSYDAAAQPNPTNQNDSNDNGIDNSNPVVNGITSRQIQLVYLSESTTEFDLAPAGTTTVLPGPQSRGRFGETNNDSDLTIDFGFVRPPMSIGNQVWLDDHPTIAAQRNNAIFDPGETPIPNVEVALYRDLDADGAVDAGEDTGLRDTTSANGYYLFGNLVPNNYIVAVTQANFNTGGPLANMISSRNSVPNPLAADDQVDSNDNGNDAFITGIGIISSRINLAAGTEPTGETSVNAPADGINGRGTQGELDNNSDLTIDFGFFVPMSLGNRVWLDDSNDPTNWNTTRNNAILDTANDDLDNPNIPGAQALGVAGVTLRLYRDLNTNGVIDTGEDSGRTVTTNASGYYLFDGLTRGNYIVSVEASNFTAGSPLSGFNSSTNVTSPTDNNIDNTDDGTGTVATPNIPSPTYGIISPSIVLSYTNPTTGLEPLAGVETDPTPQAQANRGANGETDAFSNLTVDFGFVRLPMSIGNRVWFDGNNNGLIDTTGTSDDFVQGGAVAPGIPGVTVQLYLDADNNGLPDSGVPIVPDVLTDANGYYLFTGLVPSRYVVAIPHSNFAVGQPLAGLVSTTGNAGDNQVDSDDNGIDLLNATYGLLSPSIMLASSTELTGETDVSAEGNGSDTNDNNGELTIDFGFYVPMSIGNRLWFDTDANGILDGFESGVPAGVDIGLYRDENSDDTPDGPAIATTITDATGYYLFDGLGSGRYIVIVEANGFQPSGLLVNYISSAGEDTTENTDNNDNGVNNTAPVLGGVRSNVITLVPNTLPTTEVDLGSAGNGSYGETNNNSNLTIDFGFINGSQLSLGNLVWVDNGGTGTGTARDGIRNGDELPIANVTVSLYLDADSNGIPDDLGAQGAADDILATDTTDVNGQYLFNNLTPGNYVVELAASNFSAGAILDGYGSTVTATLPNQNNYDYGVDAPDTLTGIRSATISIAVNAEPTGDTDPVTAKGYGANGIDANGNMTVDFGVYRPMSVGNRVWLDTDKAGTINGTEIGIAGVTVELRTDTDNNGQFNPANDLLVTTTGVTATDVTDSLGYYLFSNLLPGTYFVYIPPSQFTSGSVLDGFSSTTDNVGGIPADSNDNGVSDGGSGVVSNLFTLTENGEPTNEVDFSNASADGPRFIGNNGENNTNSNLTIDFGFTTTAATMSLGNRVWLDTNDNGLMDAGDDYNTGTAGDQPGVPGALVNLYIDTNADGIPDGAALATDTTDANGYYLFGNLPPGNYLVQIAPTNFQTGGVLQGLSSSSATSNDLVTDTNDNGIDNNNPGTNGIFSDTITLTPNTMPLGETDLSGNPLDGANSRGTNGETDGDSNLTIDFGFNRRIDWGDAPDSYATTNGAGGPSHVISNTLFIGSIEDSEVDGLPSPAADGDDTNNSNALGDDEDGVTIPTAVAGTNLNIIVSMFNNTGVPATLIGWVDLDGNGTFEAAEAATANIPSSAVASTTTLTFAVPATADIDTGGQTYARFRMTTDATISTNTPGGAASDGEVEDYRVTMNPPGVSITKTDTLNSIVVGQTTTYTITLQYSGLTPISRMLNDTTTPANAFVPGSVSWTCDANAQASCVTGQPLGTDIATDSDAATPPITGLMTGQNIDLIQGGQIIYRLTGTLIPDYNTVFPGLQDVINTVALSSGETASDTNGVIFDPPFGVKTGTALNATTIRWTMVWFNTSQTQGASITDVLPTEQTNPTNLVCTPFGTTTTTVCEIRLGNTIFWDGTMGDGTAPADRTNNRLEISFDVTVQGTGTYNNAANITTAAGNTFPSSGSVVIPSSNGGSTGGANEGSTNVLDPTITKTADTEFSFRGGTVAWTIQIINPFTQVIPNITVSDNLPADLEILSTTSTNGTVKVDGQAVTISIPALNAKETAFIIVTTRINENTKATEFVNFADLYTLERGKIQSVGAKVTLVSELPSTGQVPIYWQIIRILVLGLILTISIGGIGLVIYRRTSS